MKQITQGLGYKLALSALFIFWMGSAKAQFLFQEAATTEATLGVTQTLDALFAQEIALPGSISPHLLALMTQMQTLSEPELQVALGMLTPPVSYSFTATTRLALDRTFNLIQRRLVTLHHLCTATHERYQIVRPLEDCNSTCRSGMNFGDESCFQNPCQLDSDIRETRGVWIAGYGSVLRQSKRQDLSAFRAEATGIAIGTEWEGDVAFMGFAVSLSKAQGKERTVLRHIQDVHSTVWTFYGSINPEKGFYLDGQLGFAIHHYKTRRDLTPLVLFPLTAFGDTQGIQYGVQTELGYACQRGTGIFAPVLRLKHSRLYINNYTETGGDLRLTVANQGLNETLVAVGFRYANKMAYTSALYSPYFSFLVGYDFSKDSAEHSAQFIGDGPLFITKGAQPSHLSWLIGGGVDSETADGYIFRLAGQLEKRDHYYTISAMVRFLKQW